MSVYPHRWGVAPGQHMYSVMEVIVPHREYIHLEPEHLSQIQIPVDTKTVEELASAPTEFLRIRTHRNMTGHLLPVESYEVTHLTFGAYVTFKLKRED